MLLLEYVSYMNALNGAIENKQQFTDCACHNICSKEQRVTGVISATYIIERQTISFLNFN